MTSDPDDPIGPFPRLKSTDVNFPVPNSPNHGESDAFPGPLIDRTIDPSHLEKVKLAVQSMSEPQLEPSKPNEEITMTKKPTRPKKRKARKDDTGTDEDIPPRSASGAPARPSNASRETPELELEIDEDLVRSDAVLAGLVDEETQLRLQIEALEEEISTIETRARKGKGPADKRGGTPESVEAKGDDEVESGEEQRGFLGLGRRILKSKSLAYIHTL
jgi:hypothetical protein